MVRRGTTPFNSRICPEIYQTPWATTQGWCSPPRTGITATSAVPTVTQVAADPHVGHMFILLTRDAINQIVLSGIICTHVISIIFSGGWWFNACRDANLNGRYFHSRPKGRQERRRGIHWRAGPKSFYILKLTQISVHPEASPSPTSSSASSSSETDVFQWPWTWRSSVKITASNSYLYRRHQALFHVDGWFLKALAERKRV